MPGKGGAYRTKVPEVDANHLADVLENYVKNNGGSSFKFGEYCTLRTPQSIHGPSLADMVPLLISLCAVEETMSFSYTTLKGILEKMLREYPQCKEPFPITKHHNLAGDVASYIMTACNHARRLKDDEAFQRAVNKCTNYRIERLKKFGEEQLPDLVVDADDEQKATKEMLQLQIPDTPEQLASQQSVIATKDTLALADPETPDFSSKTLGHVSPALADVDDSFLQEALKTEPLPPRKQQLIELMKRPAALDGGQQTMKRPAAVGVAGIESPESNKRPAADKDVIPATAVGFSNFNFESDTWGRCKAEFYTEKSYIRYWGPEGKLVLIVQCVGSGHASKLMKLIPHVKKADVTKEMIVALRNSLE